MDGSVHGSPLVLVVFGSVPLSRKRNGSRDVRLKRRMRIRTFNDYKTIDRKLDASFLNPVKEWCWPRKEGDCSA
jgi:hypothetical protein